MIKEIHNTEGPITKVESADHISNLPDGEYRIWTEENGRGLAVKENGKWAVAHPEIQSKSTGLFDFCPPMSINITEFQQTAYYRYRPLGSQINNYENREKYRGGYFIFFGRESGEKHLIFKKNGTWFGGDGEVSFQWLKRFPYFFKLKDEEVVGTLMSKVEEWNSDIPVYEDYFIEDFREDS
jgi:hypothetical protein